jgi:guanylate cyclase
VTDLLTGFWPSSKPFSSTTDNVLILVDGKMPPDEPVCGFRNEKCDYTFMIILGILALLFVLAVLFGFIIYRVM